MFLIQKKLPLVDLTTKLNAKTVYLYPSNLVAIWKKKNTYKFEIEFYFILQ